MKSRSSAVAMIASLVLAACAPRPPEKPESVSIAVSGMHCESCAEGITRALRRIPGVISTDVHFSNTVQTVGYDAAKVDATSLVAAITNIGFSAFVENEGSPL